MSPRDAAEPPEGRSFPASARIRRKREFASAFSKGKRVSGPGFTVYIEARANGESALGMAVSRKVGGAVARNRVKRLIREYFRTRRAGFQQPVALVVVARPEASAMNFTGCARALDQVLRRGGVLDG